MIDLDKDGLPRGHFFPGDILAYRALLAGVPDGGKVAEIGCYLGRSLISIAHLAKARGITIHAVDPWWYGEQGEKDYQTFLAHLNKFGVEEVVTVHRMSSTDAASLCADASCDLVFLDPPHDYKTTRDAIEAWIPKIKPGGVLAGHDATAKWPAVCQAIVDAFGDGDYSCNLNEVDYCCCWAKKIGFSAQILPVSERKYLTEMQ